MVVLIIGERTDNDDNNDNHGKKKRCIYIYSTLQKMEQQKPTRLVMKYFSASFFFSSPNSIS